MATTTEITPGPAKRNVIVVLDAADADALTSLARHAGLPTGTYARKVVKEHLAGVLIKRSYDEPTSAS